MTNINIKELSAEQIADIKKQIEDLENPKKYKRERAEKGKTYHYISHSGDINVKIEYNDSFNDHCFETGNYYLTKEEAEEVGLKKLAIQKAITKINDRIDELNEGWVPNWIEKQKKFIIYYYPDTKQFDIVYDYYVKFPIFFHYIKSEGIGRQIIREFERELKLILNIK